MPKAPGGSSAGRFWCIEIKIEAFNMPKPLPLGEVSLQSNDGEGKPGEAEPLHSDRQTLCQSETIAASMSLCQHPCPLRRSAPDSPFCRLRDIFPRPGEVFPQRESLWRGNYTLFSAASTTWRTSTEVVTVPTPPGTGVMASTTGSASPKRTSPQSLPSSLTWMPTSTTT